MPTSYCTRTYQERGNREMKDFLIDTKDFNTFLLYYFYVRVIVIMTIGPTNDAFFGFPK